MTKKSIDTRAGGLDPKDVQLVLFNLNDAAADTLDGGAYSRWRFIGLERDGNTWKLSYTNSGHPNGDFVRFEHAGPCVEKKRVSRKWEDAAFGALNDESADDY